MTFQKRRLVLLGALILALAAAGLSFALLSGRSNGYETCVKALEKFLFEAPNFTASGRTDVLLDGKSESSQTALYQRNGGAGSYERETSVDENGETTETVRYIQGGDRYTNIDDDARLYSKYTAYGYTGDAAEAILSNTELTQRYFRLGKTAFDLAGGSLKSLIVRQGSEDGQTVYTLNMKQAQLPEMAKIIEDIVRLEFEDADNRSSGLSLAFRGSGFLLALDDMESSTRYEDRQAAFRAYYLKRTGLALPENFFELTGEKSRVKDATATEDDPYSALGGAYDAMVEEMNAQYQALAGTQEAVVFISEDGTPTVYENLRAYRAAGLDQSRFIGDINAETLRFESLSCEARVNDAGLPTYARAEMRVILTDYQGAEHALEMRIVYDLSDYGQTTPVTFNPEGYTDRSDLPKQKTEYETVEIEVEFNGLTYTVEDRRPVQ